MMTQADFRYTDRDVREGGTELVDLVLRYLDSYQGDFAFLLDAKARVAMGRSLSVSMARGVLNCMRNDARLIMDLPEPKFAVTLGPRLRVVHDYDDEPEPRPSVIKLNARFKFDFWYSTHKQAKYYHIVDKTTFSARFYTSRGDYRFVVNAVCGRYLREHQWSHWTNDKSYCEYVQLTLCQKCKGDTE